MKKDVLHCTRCGATVDGFNEFTECPRCKSEAPGIWEEDCEPQTAKQTETDYGIIAAVILIILIAFFSC